jgi:hypothetical protein
MTRKNDFFFFWDFRFENLQSDIVLAGRWVYWVRDSVPEISGDVIGRVVASCVGERW